MGSKRATMGKKGEDERAALHADDNTPDCDPWADVCIDIEKALADAQAQGAALNAATKEKNKGTGFYKRFATMQRAANNTINECGLTLDVMEEVIISNRKVGTDQSKPSKV